MRVVGVPNFKLYNFPESSYSWWRCGGWCFVTCCLVRMEYQLRSSRIVLMKGSCHFRKQLTTTEWLRKGNSQAWIETVSTSWGSMSSEIVMWRTYLEIRSTLMQKMRQVAPNRIYYGRASSRMTGARLMLCWSVIWYRRMWDHRKWMGVFSRCSKNAGKLWWRLLILKRFPDLRGLVFTDDGNIIGRFSQTLRLISELKSVSN